MFELFLHLCLAGDPAVCATHMVPSAVALTEADCNATAGGRSDGWLTDHSGLTLTNVECRRLTPSDAISVVQVADGVWAHKGVSAEVSMDNLGDIANLGFIVGKDAVAVIDAGGTRTIAEGLYAAIRQVTDLPVRYLILTHMHPDHALGADVFREAGAEIVGNVHLADALQRRAETYEVNFQRLIGAKANIGLKVALPDRGVEGQLVLDLGAREVLLQSYKTAHTNNDLTVFDKTSETLFTGDLVFLELTPVVDGALMGWLAVLADMSKLEVKFMVPGHGAIPQPWPEGLSDVTTYLEALRDQTRAAVAEGISLSDAIETVAQDQRGNWQAFDLNHPRNATVAYTELEWE